jgi:hypothetical protein
LPVDCAVRYLDLAPATARFLLEPLAMLVFQELDCNDALEPPIAGLPYFAHSARTYAGEDFLGAKPAIIVQPPRK